MQIKISAPKGQIELKFREDHNLASVTEEIVTKGGFTVEGMKESLTTYLQTHLSQIPELAFKFKDAMTVKPFYPTARPIFYPVLTLYQAPYFPQ